MRAFFVFGLVYAISAHASTPDWNDPEIWREGVEIPSGQERSNIFNLSEEDLLRYRLQGYRHTLKWPVEVTGLQIPYDSFQRFFQTDPRDFLKRRFLDFGEGLLGFRDEATMYKLRCVRLDIPYHLLSS